MTTTQLIKELTKWEAMYGPLEVRAAEFLESSVGYEVANVCMVENEDDTKTLYVFNKWV
jgi:hypothetical protein